MRDAEARLQSFQNIPTHNGTRVEIEEVVALVIFGFYKTENNGHFVVRCSFCKKSFQYRLYEADAAARLNRLRITHAITSHTCALSLNHLGDDKPFDETRTRFLLGGASHTTPTLHNSNGSALSLTSHINTSLTGDLSSFINLSDSLNARESMKSISVDNTAFFEYSAATEFECDVEFNSMPSLDIAEWSLPSVYKPHSALIDALVGIHTYFIYLVFSTSDEA